MNYKFKKLLSDTKEHFCIIQGCFCQSSAAQHMSYFLHPLPICQTTDVAIGFCFIVLFIDFIMCTSASVRKAIIPAAGMGTRVLPASKAIPKEMLNIVDKPAIQYIVEEAFASGIE